MAGAGGSPYCSIADVQAMNWARTMGLGSNPGQSQVWIYINMVAGEIDAILTTKGYQVPVNIPSSPEAAAFLNSVNAKGAWWMWEAASPNSLNIDRAKAAYDAAIKLLSDSKFSMDVPMNMLRAEARGPWATMTPTGNIFDPTTAAVNNGQPGNGIVNANDGFSNPADPFFSRSMEF